MKRHLRAKKINELIFDFLEIQDSKKNQFDSFDQLWKEVVGDVVSSKTKSIIYKKNTLYVCISDKSIQSDLLLQKDKILIKIKSLNKNVEKIIFS